MTQEKLWTIRDIEALTEDAAREMALTATTVKRHNVYLVDFGGYFKFSALVFADGRHTYHANLYELHYPGRTRKELQVMYMDFLYRALFTEEEITAPLLDYAEYRAKEYYLRNLYPQRRENISLWFAGPETERERLREKTKAMTWDGIAFAWFEDADFVRHHLALYEGLERARDAMAEDEGYWKDAFLREMANHEYHINWEANYDLFSAFGNVRYVEDECDYTAYMDQLHMNDTQRRAFRAARADYLRAHIDD